MTPEERLRSEMAAEIGYRMVMKNVTDGELYGYSPDTGIQVRCVIKHYESNYDHNIEFMESMTLKYGKQFAIKSAHLFIDTMYDKIYGVNPPEPSKDDLLLLSAGCMRIIRELLYMKKIMDSKATTGKIYAIDFDGTCVSHEFPRVGRFIGAEVVLRRLVNEGNRLILWTMRSGEQLEDAISWFSQRGIPLYGINNNPEQQGWTSSQKAYANAYIDDAALGCPLKKGLPGEKPYVDWEKISEMLWPQEPEFTVAQTE